MNILSAFLFLLSLFGCSNQQIKNNSTTEVYVLGSIHGNMLDQPHNSLRDFVRALYLFKPTMILSEVRPEFPDPVEGAIDGGAEQALVYAFVKQNGSLAIPVDWFDDQYHIASGNEPLRMTEDTKKQIEPYLSEFRKIIQRGTFQESQSFKTQTLIRTRYDILAKQGLTSLRVRDQVICRNIKGQEQRFVGHRVLVVFGLAHKYYLEDCLREMGIQPLSLESWLDTVKMKEVSISNDFKQDAVQTFKKAKSTLSKRLKEGYYKSDIENLKEKVVEFDDWIQKTNAL